MTTKFSRRALMFVPALAFAAWAGQAQAAPQSFKVQLDGASEVPPVQTAGKATANITYDPVTRVLTWNVTYEGLSGPATMAHFHGPAAAGKNGPVVVWVSKQGSPATAR